MRAEIIALSVPGEPQGKQRPKWSKVGTYSPKKTVNYETYIKELFAVAYPDFEPVESALEMELTAGLLIPPSQSNRKKRLMEEREIRPTKRPDGDNVLKVVMDALEGLAYKNDSQIVTALIEKYYTKKPGLEIRIFECSS